jgi:hypothetical protein
MSLGGERRQVYVPLAITQTGSAHSCSPFELVLSTEARLKEVLLSLVQIDSSGGEIRTVKRDEPLRRGFYPAGAPIVINLKRADLHEPGFYALKLSATLTPRGDFARNYVLFIPATDAC